LAASWCSVISKCATYIRADRLGLSAAIVKKMMDLVNNFPSLDRLRSNVMSMIGTFCSFFIFILPSYMWIDKVSECSDKFKKQVGKISEFFFQDVDKFVDDSVDLVDKAICVVTDPIEAGKKV
jgi:hypothetical protein